MVRIQHLIKLYFYPEAGYERNGWMRTVYNSVDYVPSLKGVSKRPLSMSFILNAIWGDDFADLLKDGLFFCHVLDSVLMKDYLPPHFPLESEWVDDCYNFCRGYHEWLAGKLAGRRFVVWQDCVDKLNQMLEVSVFKRDLDSGFAKG
jgi:hypothetical protein